MYRLTLAAFFLHAIGLGAQSVTDHIAFGDKEYAALRAKEALTQYESALAIEARNYEALWKASRSAMDLGEFEQNAGKQSEYFKLAESYSRRAVDVNSQDAEGHFNLARALGRAAQSAGPRAGIKYAKAVREEALKCLELNPKHPGCMHVMGVWNAEIMRLNGFLRFVAKNFLGGAIFGTASWGEAQRYMEASVATDSDRVTHQLDLGRIYVDVGQKAKARTAFEAVINGKTTDYNDPHYKEQAQAALKKL
jgi:tetratricopeptide (TPR) repeat protein